MTIFIFLIYESVFFIMRDDVQEKYLLSLYETMHNDNKYSCYTRRCISHYTRKRIMTNKYFNFIKKMYNKIFVSVIQEDV